LPAETIGDEGVQEEFDGRYRKFEACGITGCTNIACTPAGDYVARLCGYSGTAGTATTAPNFSSTPTCFEVPFAWPPAASGEVIERTLGDVQADAGDASMN
jgi:hypothetical protein